jgi:tRNA-guanine family transglycosylase
LLVLLLLQVEGCKCHACQHHTRAYIHHLHICKEILAEVLLYHHNVHQVLLLFRAARHHIAQGTFEEWLKRVRATM